MNFFWSGFQTPSLTFVVLSPQFSIAHFLYNNLLMLFPNVYPLLYSRGIHTKTPCIDFLVIANILLRIFAFIINLHID